MRDVVNHFERYNNVDSFLLIDGCNQEMQPDLSVMIPTYLRPLLLKEAILSVINQADHNINVEIVVVDNDAEANHSDLVDLINDLLPNNIRLFRNKENIGMFGNWNRCIELARAPLLTILNDDDQLHPDFIKLTFDMCQQRAISVSHVTFDEANTIKWSTVPLQLKIKPLNKTDFFIGNPIPGSLGLLMNKGQALELGGYNTELWPTADYDFSYRYFKRFGINQTSTKLSGYRWQENESMKVATLEGFMANDIIFRTNMVNTSQCSFISKKILKMLSELMATSAAIHYRAVNNDFNTERTLKSNSIPPVYFKILRIKILHSVFIRLRKLICHVLFLV